MSVIPWSVILDPQRLEELRSLEILDTQPEQSYNDLAELARLICGMPVATVTLVSESRQWFKARAGSDIPETPVAQSICAHVLSEPDSVVINDLTSDSRTSTNSLVTGEPALRFYAGVPLRLGPGFGVGTLCVLDTKPHPDGLTPEQVGALRALGRQATILLQIRRYLAGRADDTEAATNEETLGRISDALMAAYDLNKVYGDRILEGLIAGSLTHIALRIARDEVPGLPQMH